VTPRTACVALAAVLSLAGCNRGGVLHGGKLGPRLGVEAGYFMPLAGAEQDYQPGVMGGAVLRMGANLDSALGVEFALAGTSLQADGADASSDLLFLRARGLYAVGLSGLCLSAGMQLAQQGAVEEGESLDSFTGATIDLGALIFFAKRYEVGLTYSMLYASENVPGTVALTGGVAF
jgi:hypothetical protein